VQEGIPIHEFVTNSLKKMPSVVGRGEGHLTLLFFNDTDYTVSNGMMMMMMADEWGKK
jgi:hypothetical protein